MYIRKIVRFIFTVLCVTLIAIAFLAGIALADYNTKRVSGFLDGQRLFDSASLPDGYISVMNQAVYVGSDESVGLIASRLSQAYSRLYDLVVRVSGSENAP